MRLRAGERAIPFATRDIAGKPIQLEDYAGRKLLLSFNRLATCPLCNVRMYHLVQRYPQYRAQGLEIVLFTDSTPETTTRYLGPMAPPFPLIADPQRALYQLYGVESSKLRMPLTIRRLPVYAEAAVRRLLKPYRDGDITLLPADFLIGPDLVIQRAHYGRDYGDYLLFEVIDHFAAQGVATTPKGARHRTTGQ
ncbi:MAG TPA: redoxin domain-containing protein [Ktedonobacterales bacterium]